MVGLVIRRLYELKENTLSQRNTSQGRMFSNDNICQMRIFLNGHQTIVEGEYSPTTADSIDRGRILSNDNRLSLLTTKENILYRSLWQGRIFSNASGDDGVSFFQKFAKVIFQVLNQRNIFMLITFNTVPTYVTFSINIGTCRRYL